MPWETQHFSVLEYSLGKSLYIWPATNCLSWWTNLARFHKLFAESKLMMHLFREKLQILPHSGKISILFHLFRNSLFAVEVPSLEIVCLIGVVNLLTAGGMVQNLRRKVPDCAAVLWCLCCLKTHNMLNVWRDSTRRMWQLRIITEVGNS